MVEATPLINGELLQSSEDDALSVPPDKSGGYAQGTPLAFWKNAISALYPTILNTDMSYLWAMKLKK